MRGGFLKACDCFVPCPCWFQQEPSEDECTGLMAWQIEQGEIESVDVSGLSVVSVSHHGGQAHGAVASRGLSAEYASDRADRRREEVTAAGRRNPFLLEPGHPVRGREVDEAGAVTVAVVLADDRVVPAEVRLDG